MSTDPTSPAFAGPCPRCGGAVPNEHTPGKYPGALSRVDNRTYICSMCGTAEAMFNFLHRGVDLPPVTEPIPL
jgi:transposase